MVRVDKWLWAARLFKTRSLAAAAVSGGKVHLNGERTRPARGVRVGDQLRVQRGTVEMVVLVRELGEIRRRAPEAARLYAETDESWERREHAREQARLAASVVLPGRPSRRDRREVRRFRRGE